MRREPSSGPGASTLVALRILIFHGYLLGGTGSNVYNAALAEALGRAGHEVHLLSQDRDPLAHAVGRRGGRLGRRDAPDARRGAPPRGSPSTARPSSCCPSTSPTATRASRPARSPS